MSYKVSILSEAEADIDNPYIWYESKQVDLGNLFFRIIEKSVDYISNNPFVCKEIYKGIR